MFGLRKLDECRSCHAAFFVDKWAPEKYQVYCKSCAHDLMEEERYEARFQAWVKENKDRLVEEWEADMEKKKAAEKELYRNSLGNIAAQAAAARSQSFADTNPMGHL